MQILIKTFRGNTVVLNVSNDTTINQIKDMINEKEGVPQQYLRLACEGKPLYDDHTVAHYNIRNQSILYLSMRIL